MVEMQDFYAILGEKENGGMNVTGSYPYDTGDNAATTRDVHGPTVNKFYNDLVLASRADRIDPNRFHVSLSNGFYSTHFTLEQKFELSPVPVIFCAMTWRREDEVRHESAKIPLPAYLEGETKEERTARWLNTAYDAWSGLNASFNNPFKLPEI